MDTINPQILPPSMARKDHHRAAVVGIWVAIIAVLLGLSYWWMVKNRASSLVNSQDPQQEMISILRTSARPLPDVERQEMINILKGTK
jgi:hypothetical protein